MKKIVCLLLALLLVFAMAGCNSDNDAGNQDGENSNTAITRTVLVDEADVKITALSLSEQTVVGPELKLQIENKTDKKLVFQSRDTAVNKYLVESIMSVEVDAGEKEKCSMILSSSSLNACGITTIASMEMRFRVFDASNWQQYLLTEPITLNTKANEGFEYTFQHDGVTVHAENGVKIVIKEPIKPGDIKVYIYNSSEADIAVQTAVCNINAVAVDPQFYEQLPVDKHVVTEIIFAEELLEENGITEASEIELSFQILNDATGEIVVETETVKLPVQ